MNKLWVLLTVLFVNLQVFSQIDNTLIGTWNGELIQTGFEPYAINLSITNLVIGESSGLTNYPSLPCLGEHTFIENTNEIHVFSEIILSGDCVSGEMEIYKLSEDTIQLNWRYPNSTNIESYGVLTRAMEMEILGCTDSNACNYNESATEDDESCLYESDALSNPIEIIYIEDVVFGEIGEDLIAPVHIRNSSCDNMTGLVVRKIFNDPNANAYFCFNGIAFPSTIELSPNPMSLDPFEEDDFFRGYLNAGAPGFFEVTYEFYLENDPSIIQQRTIIYCVEDNCFESGLEEVEKNKTLINKIDILGKETNNKGLQLHIYDDGSVEKKYLIK